MTDAFATLVGLTYEGAVEAKPWQSFAEELRQVLDARNVVITLHHAENEKSDTYLMAQIPDDRIDWAAVEAHYRAELMEDDPFRPDRMAPGEVGITEVAAMKGKWHAFMHDLGLVHNLRICFAEPDGIRCWVDVVRGHPSSDRPFSTDDIALIRELSPHLNRALALYAKLQRQASEKAIYEGMVDHFALGCALLNEEGEVIHLNHIATALIGHWPGISIFRGRITLSDRPAQRALEVAVNAVTTARSSTSRSEGELVRLGDCQGRLLGLLIYPAPPQPYYRGGQAPSAIVYLSDLTANLEALRPTRSHTLGRIAQLFDLTRQESTLALHLAYGHTIAEAAGEMSIAETAARNYSKKIYAKMGVASQTELVRLMLRSLSFLL